jgi:Fur family ferric uptake transcriptional regulator
VWLRRYEEKGLEGLRNRSSRPHYCPHETSAENHADRAGLSVSDDTTHEGDGLGEQFSFPTLMLRIVSFDLNTAVAERLADVNLIYTDRRRRLVETIAKGPGPMSADELHRKLRNRMSLASLYRSLSQMEEAGVIAVHHSSGRASRFELSAWLAGHHHHLVCDNCGVIIEMELTSLEEDRVESIVRAASKREDFLAGDHVLEITGLCSSCRPAA